MQIDVPQSDRHSAVKFLIQMPKGDCNVTCDSSQKTVQFELPPGVKEDEVRVVASFLDGSHQPDKSMESMVLKEKVIKAAPKVEPKPEAKPVMVAPKEVKHEQVEGKTS